MLTTYTTYKDSEVEWVGEVPSHYRIGKLKHLCDENQRSLSNSTDPNYELNYVEISDVNSKGVIEKSTPYIFSESPSRCRRIVQKGDVIVSTVRTYLKSIGLIEEEVEGLICSTGFSVLTPRENINPKYLFYLLRTEWFISMVISNSEGVSYPSIQSEKLMNIDVVFCDFSEQQKIISFLDSKTLLIDSLIEKTRRKIELLKEKRTSLINEVVTRGLNPNVEMKDSGIEWIGEIPNHYQIGKLKHLCNENQRSLSNSTDPNYELNYIEISDVNSEGVIGNSTPYIFSESPSRCRRIVQKGDVIVSTVRTYLKSIGLIEEEVEDLICSTGFSVLTPNTEINSKYLFYLLRTEWFISMVISNSEGVSYPSIQSEKLMNIDVIFCEFSEQQQMVKYLDEQTQLIDKTVSIEEDRIELLKEYRQSLISELVTGKRKVVE